MPHYKSTDEYNAREEFKRSVRAATRRQEAIVFFTCMLGAMGLIVTAATLARNFL